MATNGGSINYTVKYNVDKTGLNQMKASLQEIFNLSKQDLIKINSKATDADLAKLKASAKEVESALERAFNPNLGTLNVSKFNQELKKLDVKRIYQDFSIMGQAGRNAFRNITSDILTTNMQLKQTHTLLDNMATTMANTIKWGVASSIMNTFTGSVQQAYGYVKNLDSSLNDIRIVTNKSADEMAKFAVQANKAAKELGASTTSYTDASLIYYQQGLTDAEVAARAEVTLKAANVTGQSADAVSEQLTAVWNGYKVSAEEAELYIDKLAAVAATTASDLEELSTGMSKVASAASIMGVDVDQLNAQLATIVSVTRQAPESVGTALKTIYARMGDIEAGLDGETSLSNYTEQMAQMGYDVLDANGKLRDMGQVIEEIGNNWKNMSREQQISLSQTVAGTRQYNNLLALFDNWDMYTKAIETSGNAAGTLQKQQDIYMDRTVAHLQQLRTATEDLYDSLFETKSFNNLLDGITGAVDLLGSFVDAIGGGGNVLLALGSIGSKVFSKQLAGGIATFINNMQTAKNNATQLRAELEILNQYEGANINDERVKVLIDMKRQILDLNKNITIEERNIANEYIKQQNELFKQQDALEARKKAAEDTYRTTIDSTSTLSVNNSNDAKIMARELEFSAKEFETSKVSEGTIQGSAKAYEELTQSIRTYIDVANGQKKVNKDLATADAELTQMAKQHQNTIKQQLVSAQLVAASDEIEEKNKRELKNALEELDKLRNRDGTLNLRNIRVVKQLQTVEAARIKTYKNQAETMRQASKEVLGFADATKKAKESTDQLQNSYNGFISQLNLRDKIQQGIQLASSFGQVASAILSIGRIPDIWENNDLSTSEKWLQTISSLGYALPSLINGFSLIGKTLGLNTQFTNAAIAAKEKYLLTTVQATGSEKVFNNAKAHGISIETAYQIAMNKTKMTKEQIIAINRVYAQVKKGEISAEAADIAIKEILAGANIKVAFSFKTAAAAAKSFAASLGPLAWIAIAAGLITGLVFVLDELTVSAQEAGENLKASIESYKEVENELKSLEDQLSTTKDRLLELFSLAERGELTLAQEEEITKLQAQNAELETQIALLKQKQELEERKVARDANEAYDKGTYNDNFGKTVFQNEEWTSHKEGITKYEDADTAQVYNDKGIVKQSLSTEDFEIQVGEIKLDDASTFDSWEESMLQLESEALKNASNAKSDSETEEWKEVAAAIREDLKAKETEYGERRQSYLNHLESGYTMAKDALPALKAQNTYGQYDDTIKYYEQITYDYFKQIGTLDSIVEDTIINNLKLNDTQKKELQTNENLIQEDGTVDESKIKEIIGIDNFEQLKTYADTLGLSMSDVISTYQEMNGLLGLTEAEIKEELEKRRSEKEAEIAKETTEKFKDNDLGKNQTLTTEDIRNSGFTVEDLQNWEQISSYLDKDIIKTEGWQVALKKAKAEYEEIIALQQSNQVLSTAAKEYDLDLEELKTYKELLLETNPELKEHQEGLDAIVIANKRMEKGVKEISSNWEEFNNIMSNSDASMEDVSSVLPDINNALQDILNLNAEEFQLLPADFAQKHWDLINDVTNGVEGAVDELRDIAGQDILLTVTGALDTTQLDADLIALHEQILSYDNYEEFKVGVAIDPLAEADFYTACQGIIDAAGMTAEQASAYFKNLGYNIEFNEAENIKKSSYEVPNVTIDPESGIPIVGDPEKIIIETENRVAGTAIKTITPTGSYGGGIGVNTTAPKSSTAPKTKKSGGGNSKPDKMDSNKDKVDIYHDINMEIKSLSNEIEKLGKKENKLFGQQLIDNLNEQLGVLQAQTEAYKEKIELAKKEAALYRSNLASQGVSFDSQGNVTNYIAAMQGKQDYLNSLIAKYNAMSKTEQEKFKETVEQAKKDYDQFKTDMEYYENLISETIPDLEEEIQDALDKQIEIQIQKFTMEVEIRLDMAEAERDWNEFKKKVIDDIDEDDILGNAMAKMLDFSSYYKDNGKGVIEVLTRQVNDTLEQLRQIDETGTSSVYGDNKSQAMEDLQTYYTELMSQLEDVHDLVDEIRESYLDMIDEANEKFDEQIDRYETISDLIEHNMSVIELLNGDDAYDSMDKYYKMQEQNNLKQLDFHRQEVDFWKEKMEAEEEGSEAWEAYRENWQAAVADLNEAVEKSVEDLIAKYQNTVNSIFDDLNSKLTDGKGLDYIGEEWDLINKNADQYLDTVNSIFAVQELENKYLDALDNTDSISAQNKLNDLMNEQLEMLREKEKLTQYDVDRANALYEIALKEIALQDAQQSKSQMRLRRDAQGNYSYQFVSDQDAIGQAEEELAAAQNSLYNMDKDQYRANLDEIYEVYVEFQEKLNELYLDNTLSDIEREEQKKLLVEQYGELINGLVEQNEDIRLNLQESALMELAEFQDTILMEELIPQWDSGVQTMTDKFAGEGGFIPTCQDSLIELDEATKDYEGSLEDLEDTAGISFDEIEDGLDTNIDLTYEFIDANDELINKYDEQIGAIQNVQDELDYLISKYDSAKQAAEAATEAAYKYWQVQQELAAGYQGGVPEYNRGGSGDYFNTTSTNSNSNPNKNSDINNSINSSKNPSGGNSTYYKITGGNGSWQGIGSDGAHWLSSNDLSKLKSVAKNWYSKYTLNGGKISSLNTGGYTGEWTNGDTNGRLAFLHQKELVLNSEDTENILSAVNVVRSIGGLLTSLKTSMNNRIAGLTSKFSRGNDVSNNGMTIEQKVSIEAKFEGQTESSQIETALMNLVNYASQHAYDTKR